MANTSTEEKHTVAAAAALAPARPAAVQTEVFVDESEAQSAYANFARVTATPEEVIVDFALNPTPFAAGRQNVTISQRLIMNFYTAKRLLGALQMTIQRHEGAFGAIELDVRRRANLATREIEPPMVAPQVNEVPVRIWLSEGQPQLVSRVTQSVEQLWRTLGFDFIEAAPPKRGSFLGQWIARGWNTLSRKEVQDRLKKLERALELKGVDKPQADVDETLAKAVQTLMASLDKVANAAVQLGSVLLVKITNEQGVASVVVTNLSQRELALIRNNPEVLGTPEKILPTLSGTSGTSGFQLKQPIST